MPNYNPVYVPPFLPTGNPWANGGAPGISATALDQIEGWMYMVDNPPDVTLNGTTAGTAHLWEMVFHNRKEVLIFFAGYENSTSTRQSIVLPTPFSTIAMARATGIGSPDSKGVYFYLSGTAQNVTVPSSLSGGGHSTITGGPLASWTPIAGIASGFDTIEIDGNYTGPANGIVHLVGN